MTVDSRLLLLNKYYYRHRRHHLPVNQNRLYNTKQIANVHGTVHVASMNTNTTLTRYNISTSIETGTGKLRRIKQSSQIQRTETHVLISIATRN